MRKYVVGLIIFFTSIEKGGAQQFLPMAEKAYSDSLVQVLQSRASDSTKALVGFQLSDYWRTKDTSRSRTYLLLGQHLAKNYPYLRALYYFYEGQYYFNNDIALPDINGITLCQKIKKKAPGTLVLIFSNHSERSMIMQALQNGASGYLLKNASLEELRNGFHEAMNGGVAFSREVREIISRPSKNELQGPPQLTRREKQIIKLLAEGKTSVKIADELSVSAHTIDTHRRNLMQKFGVKNSAELIRTAMLHQFI